MAKTKGGAKAVRPAQIAKAKPKAESGKTAPAVTVEALQPAESAKAAPAAKSAKVALRATTASAEPALEKTASAGLAPEKPRVAALAPVPDEPASPSATAVSASAPDEDEDEIEDENEIQTRDIARLLHYGERLGTDTIDIRVLPLQLHVGSGSLAVFDPGEPNTWHVLDRPIGRGAFRVMLSIARPDATAGGEASGRERLAAVVIHAGRPPIAKWTVAHFRGERPASADTVPRTAATTGWIALLDAGDGPPGVLALPPATGLAPIEVPLTDGRRAIALPCNRGEFAAYWALDAADRPICIVIDLDAFPPKAWRTQPPTRAT